MEKMLTSGTAAVTILAEVATSLGPQHDAGRCRADGAAHMTGAVGVANGGRQDGATLQRGIGATSVSVAASVCMVATTSGPISLVDSPVDPVCLEQV